MPALFAVAVLILASPAHASTIDFSEFPIGTIIGDQYASQGVVFYDTGDGLPVIAGDVSMPDAPILRPGPSYFGNFGMDFTQGGGAAFGVMFDSGIWNALNTAIINVYSPTDVLLATLTNTGLGVQHIDLSGFGNIGRVEFDSSADADGGDIDNLSFTPVPEPGTVVLLGSGLLLAFELRRKLART